jgi:hypothetical protein
MSTNNNDVAAGNRKTTSLLRQAGLGLAALVAAGTALVGACALSVPSAGASVTALSQVPTFGCTANSINVAQVKLNDDNGTVRLLAEVDVWTSSGWTVAATSPVATVDTNEPFSGLYDPTFNFTASPGHYFQVFIWSTINGGSLNYTAAQALRDHYSNTICYTS